MTGLGKTLILIGVVLIVIGAIVLLLERFGLHLGRLPGDIVWRRGNTTVYFPIVTSLLLSVLLTIIFLIFRR